MVTDEQTQTLPAEREALERFARFLGFADRDAFAKVLLEPSRQGAAPLFAAVREDARRRQAGAGCFPPTPTTARRSTGSAELGFRAPLEASAIVRHWLAGGHRSLKGEVARGAS